MSKRALDFDFNEETNYHRPRDPRIRGINWAVKHPRKEVENVEDIADTEITANESETEMPPQGGVAVQKVIRTAPMNSPTLEEFLLETTNNFPVIHYTPATGAECYNITAFKFFNPLCINYIDEGGEQTFTTDSVKISIGSSGTKDIVLYYT